MVEIDADGSYPKRELFHDAIDEVDGIRLSESAEDLGCTNSRSVIDRCLLAAPDGRSIPSRGRRKSCVYLQLMAKYLLLVAMRVHGAPSSVSMKSPTCGPSATKYQKPCTTQILFVTDLRSRDILAASKRRVSQ